MSKEKHANGTEVRILHTDGKWYEGYIVDCMGMNKQYGWQYRCRIPQLEIFSHKCHDGGKLEVINRTPTGRVKIGPEFVWPSLSAVETRYLCGNNALLDIRATLTATAIKQASDKMDQDFLNQCWDQGNAALRRFVEYRISEAVFNLRKERDVLRIERDQLQERNNSQAQQLGNLRDMVGNTVQAKAALSKGGWGIVAIKPGCEWHLVRAPYNTQNEASSYARKLAETNTTTKYTVIALGESFMSVEKQVITREVKSV